MNKNEKILMINNPISGGKRKERDLILKKFISESGKKIELVNTQYPGHASELTQDGINNGIKHFIAVGGDGTLNEIGKNLIGIPKLSLGIIPFGSGNGLAKSLQLPRGKEKAFQVAIGEKKTLIDTGSLNGKHFLSIAGIGFDAEIAEDFSKTKTRGLKNYINAVIKKYPTYKENKYTLNVDDQKTTHNAIFISFANSNQFGNGVKISPKSQITDGKIDICIMKKIPSSEVIFVSPLLFMEQMQNTKFLKIISCEKAIMDIPENTAMHIDGEPIERQSGELILETLKQSLSIHTK